jgi:hypothetical protein
MIVGVALVLATTVTIYAQSAFALRSNPGCGDVLPCPPGGNGVRDGQTAPGLATACANPTAGQDNPNCNGGNPGGDHGNPNNGQPTGQSIISGLHLHR